MGAYAGSRFLLKPRRPFNRVSHYQTVVLTDTGTGHAAVSFHWGSTAYTKGAQLPVLRETQFRHMRARGYGRRNATLVVGKPFNLGGTVHSAGGACPTGLTDTVLRRLVAGRFLV